MKVLHMASNVKLKSDIGETWYPKNNEGHHIFQIYAPIRLYVGAYCIRFFNFKSNLFKKINNRVQFFRYFLNKFL